MARIDAGRPGARAERRRTLTALVVALVALALAVWLCCGAATGWWPTA
jgi:hypothetical protein